MQLVAAERSARVDTGRQSSYVPAEFTRGAGADPLVTEVINMKIRNSLKALMGRHRDNKMVRRRGRIYIINKTNKRFKARQG